MSFWDGLANSLYSGAATVGSVTADVQLISTIAFAIVFIGIVLWVWNNPSVTPPPPGPGPNPQPTPSKMSKPVMMFMIAVILLLVVGSIAQWYFTNTYKPYAAVSGVGDVIRMI